MKKILVTVGVFILIISLGRTVWVLWYAPSGQPILGKQESTTLEKQIPVTFPKREVTENGRNFTETTFTENFSVNNIVNVAEKLAYIINHNELIYNGITIDKGSDNRGPEPGEIGGKLVFTKYSGDKRYFIYDGKEYGKKHDVADPMALINNKLLYVTRDYGVSSGESFIWGDTDLGEKYTSLMGVNFHSVNGKLTFAARRKNDNKMIIVHGEKEYGLEYSDVSKPFELDGKLGFFVNDKDGTSFFVHDGKEIGKGKGYMQIYSITLINEKYAFAVTQIKRKPEKFIVYDGEVVSQEYNNIDGGPKNIGGKLAYIGIKDQKHILVYDGKEIPDAAISKGFDQFEGIYSIDGILIYPTIDSSNKPFIMYGEKAIGKEYDSAVIPLIYDGKKVKSGPTYNLDTNSLGLVNSVNNKLTYIAKKDGKSFVISDGSVLGGSYDSVDELRTIGGALSFIAVNAKKVFIVYDGKEYGKEYDSARNQIDVNGKLVYLAKKDGKTFVVEEK